MQIIIKLLEGRLNFLSDPKNPTAKNYNRSDHNYINFPTVICHPLIFDYFGVALIVMLASGVGPAQWYIDAALKLRFGHPYFSSKWASWSGPTSAHFGPFSRQDGARFDAAIGCVILPKVLINIRTRHFPIWTQEIHLGEKFQKIFQIWNRSKLVEDLLYDLVKV